tara:strand:- start:1264 stop:1656 length:393 start_codon:yes stop_codon:yes gene_type:complete
MNIFIKNCFVILVVTFLSINAFSKSDENKILHWTGVVKASDLSHTKKHDHFLEFVRSGDGKVFDIVDSPELVKMHHDTNRSYKVKIEGYLTSKFLFWGGNLVVKDFKVLEALDEAPLREPRIRAMGTDRR